MKKRTLRKPTEQLLYILSHNLRKLRQSKGLSQEDLAAKCNLHRTYIGSVERGERNITLSSLEALASSLGVSVIQLLSEQEI